MTEDDPLSFLASVWRDEALAPELRVAAAKAALPYVRERRGAAKAAPAIPRLVLDVQLTRDGAAEGAA